MRKIIEKCPSCEGEVLVTRISCTECDCQVTGHFQPTIFNRLKPESLAFVETFVRLRGNIKEMERELGVPYSTIRSRLDDVISELGFDLLSTQPTPPTPPTPPSQPSDPGLSRRDILQMLDDGKLTAAEATEMLRSQRGTE